MKKQSKVNKTNEQKRKDYIDAKRIQKDKRDNSYIAIKKRGKKTIKEEIKALLQNNNSDRSNISSDSDISFSEYKNILKEDPSGYLIP